MKNDAISNLLQSLEEEDESSGESFAFSFISWAIFLTLPDLILHLPFNNDPTKTLEPQESEQLTLAETLDDLLEQLFDIMALFIGFSPTMLMGPALEKIQRLSRQPQGLLPKPTSLLAKFGCFARHDITNPQPTPEDQPAFSPRSPRC